MGKASQVSITKAGCLIGQISEHRKGEDAGKLDKRSKNSGDKPGKPNKSEKQCFNCGRKDHWSGL